MAYASYATDVQPLTGGIALRDAPVSPATTPATTPTLTEAGKVIDNIAAEIDRHLSRQRVTVPVTSGAAAYAYLTDLNATGAAARVLRAMNRNPDAAAAYEKSYREGLAFIDSGGLSSSAASTGGSFASGFGTGYESWPPDDGEAQF